MATMFNCFLLAFLQFSWVYSQSAGGAKGGEDDFGGFSLIQKDIPGSTAGTNDSAVNSTSSEESGGGDQFLIFDPKAWQEGNYAMGDQPQAGAPAPTRAPSAGGASSPPPLVRQDGNSTGNATTAQPPPTEAPKPTGGKGGSPAGFYGNLVLILGGACVLHLLY